MTRLAIDVDGVLADFNRGYRDVLHKGRKLIPHSFSPTKWNYASEEYGYTKVEENAAWEYIKDPVNSFWARLAPLAGAEKFLERLADRLGSVYRSRALEVIFVTTRPGDDAKRQTENWIKHHGFSEYDSFKREQIYRVPTVIIAGSGKKDIYSALRVTHVLDDKPEHCQAAKDVGAVSVMLSTSWNVGQRSCADHVITELDQFFDYFQ